MGDHKRKDAPVPPAKQATPAPQTRIAIGQIWDDVRVTNNPKVNRLALKVGAKLPPIQVVAHASDGGMWVCSFVGERATHIVADEDMLLTGKVRA